MMKKYNIAWVPVKHAEHFVAFSAKLAQQIMPEKYVLGAGSLPHVSICHFESSVHEVEGLWHQVQRLDLPKIRLTFDRIRSKTYPGHPQWGGVCWVSLMPDRYELLTTIHLRIAKIIKTPFNAAFEDYDPHLTLLNSRDVDQCAKWSEESQLETKLADEFCIALGEIDADGQLFTI